MPVGLVPGLSRRAALALMLAPAGGALAQQPKPSPENVAKVGSWLVGSKLGLSALVYFRQTGEWEKNFNDAKGSGRDIGIEVRPFPPRPANAQDGLIKLLDYVSKGDGARISGEIRQKHSAYHSALFDVAIRMFHVPLIYDLDPALADKITELIRTRFTVIALPDRLWKPATDAVAKRAGFPAVRAAVVQMHEDVLKHLISVARGETT